jgi:hypothetical protein
MFQSQSEPILSALHDDTSSAIFPTTASNSNLSIINYEQAEMLFYEIFLRYESIFGENHLLTLQSMYFLGLNYYHQEIYDKVEILFEACLDKCIEVFSANHFFTLITMHSLAMVKSHVNKNQESNELFQKCLHLKIKNFSENHLFTMETMFAYGKFLNSYSRSSSLVQKYFMKSYQYFKTNYGELCLKNVASSYWNMFFIKL